MPDALPARHSLANDLLADGIRYERGGVVHRARECFEAVTRNGADHPELAAEAWWHLANLHRLQSEWDDALDAAHTSAALAQQHGLPETEADALNIEGAVWWSKGDYGRARPLFERMLEVSGSDATRAKALQNLGSLAAEQGLFDDGERLLVESREAYHTAGDQRGEAVSLLNIGLLQMDRGHTAEAHDTLESAVVAAKLSGDLEMLAAAQLNFGIVLGVLGHTNEAEERITTAYGQFTIANIPAQRVRCLMQLATLAERRGEQSGARVCLTHARSVAETAGIRELQIIDEWLERLKVEESSNDVRP